MEFNSKILTELYCNKLYSAKDIARQFNCSETKINYWFTKYGIKKRSISDAVYSMHNPTGDPFKNKKLKSSDDHFLFGLGLGLYWGEGTKRNKSSVRLGNTDPHLIKKFIEFLEKIYCVKREKMKFGLQIFNNMPAEKARKFWFKNLKIRSSQFYKIIISKPRGNGTYRHKMEYGVLTIFFNNTKLRNLINSEIEKLKET